MKQLRKISEVSTQALFAKHPLKFRSERKRQLWSHLQQTCSFSSKEQPTIIRWTGSFQPKASVGTIVTVVDHPYRYTRGHWYLNFADDDLFGYYGTDLFAQDEVMAAEIPALMAVREVR